MKQPFYIAGIDDYERAKGSAFGAAAAFFFTFVVSIVYMIYDAQRLANPSGTSPSFTLPGTLRQLPNPLSSVGSASSVARSLSFTGPGGRPVFHDYDPVGADTPHEYGETEDDDDNHVFSWSRKLFLDTDPSLPRIPNWLCSGRQPPFLV